MYKNKKRYSWAIVVLISIFLLFTSGMALAASKTIVFADFGWDSAQVHNRIAGFIIKHGLGYPVKFVTGETVMLNTALIKAKGGEAPHINMETWTENWQELYDKGRAAGNIPIRTKGSSNSVQIFPIACRGFTYRPI